MNLTQSQFTIISGDRQSGLIKTVLPKPLVVQLIDSAGNPLAKVPVNFAFQSGGGSVSPTTALTDAKGRASTMLTLGQVAGVIKAIATASNIGSVSFSATAQPRTTNPIYLEKQKHGGGTVSPTTALTDANGKASTVLTLGQVAGVIEAIATICISHGAILTALLIPTTPTIL